MNSQIAMMLGGRVVESSDVDNALATATVAAVGGIRHFIYGFSADYSTVQAAGIKLIQFKFGTVVVLNVRWNAALESPFMRKLPIVIHGDYNQAVSAELQASGTGGQLGRVKLFVASI